VERLVKTTLKFIRFDVVPRNLGKLCGCLNNRTMFFFTEFVFYSRWRLLRKKQ